MAKFNYKLASQRSSGTSGNSSGLSISKISTRAGSGLGSGVRINPNAGNVRTTQHAVPGIVPDRRGEMAAKFLGDINDAAFNYQQRVDKSIADKAVTGFADLTSNAFYGDGKNAGIGTTQAEEGVAAGAEYNHFVDQKFKDTISKLTDSQKQLAVLRLNRVRTDSLRRGSSHQAKQQQVVEQNNLYASEQSVYKQIHNNAAEAFADGGAVDMFVNGIENEQERNKYLGAFGISALHETYNNVVQATGDPLKAQEETERVVRPILDKLPPKEANAVRYVLNNKKVAAKKQRDAEAKSDLKLAQKVYSQTSVPAMKDALVSGSKSTLKNIIKGFDIFTDPQEKSDNIIKAVGESVSRAVNNPALIGVGQKLAVIEELKPTIQSALPDGSIERIAVENYMDHKLQYDLNRKQDFDDTVVLNKYALDLQAEKGELVYAYPPNGTNPRGVKAWNNLFESEVRSKVEDATAAEIFAKRDFKEVIRSKARVSRITKEDVMMARDAIKDIGSEGYSYVYRKYLEGKQQGTAKPRYQSAENPAWATGMDLIEKLSKTRILTLDMKVKPKNKRKTQEDILAASNEEQAREIAFAKLTTAFDTRAQDAFKKGETFKATEWINDWILEEANKGDESNGVWDMIIGGLGAAANSVGLFKLNISKKYEYEK